MKPGRRTQLVSIARIARVAPTAPTRAAQVLRATQKIQIFSRFPHPKTAFRSKPVAPGAAAGAARGDIYRGTARAVTSDRRPTTDEGRRTTSDKRRGWPMCSINQTQTDSGTKQPEK